MGSMADNRRCTCVNTGSGKRFVELGGKRGVFPRHLVHVQTDKDDIGLSLCFNNLPDDAV